MRRMAIIALAAGLTLGAAHGSEGSFLTAKQATKKYGVTWAQGYLKAKEYFESEGTAGAARIMADYAGIVARGSGVRNTSTSTDFQHALSVIGSARDMATSVASGDAWGAFDAYFDAASTIMKHGGDAVGRRVSWDYVHRLRGAQGFWKQLRECQKKEGDNNPKLAWFPPKGDKGGKDPKKDKVEKDPKFYPHRSTEMLPKGTNHQIPGKQKIDWKGGAGKDGGCYVHRNKDGSFQRYWVNARGRVEVEGLPYWASRRDMLKAKAAAGGKAHGPARGGR